MGCIGLPWRIFVIHLASLLFLVNASAQSFSSVAQWPKQKQTDSVCALIKKYFNNKAYDSLYLLTGPTFHSRVSAGSFKSIAELEYPPMGNMENIVFEGHSQGTAWYKVIFPSNSLLLIVSLDANNKLQFYRLKQGKRNYKLSSSNRLKSDIDKIVDNVAHGYMLQQNTVGMSIGILKDGKSYFYGYGETAKGSGRIPDQTTVFEIASVTKTFTATLLAIAIEQGRARLDDPVNKYLPDSIPLLQYNNRKAILSDLVNHTSGIPFMPANFDSAVVDPLHHPNSFYSTENLYSFLKHLQLSWEPGTKYRYSNAAFGVLAVILQRIYNESYEKLLLRAICQPLNMRYTRAYIMDDSLHAAKGYDRSGQLVSPWDHRPALIGHGGLATSASDLIRFADAQLGKCTGTLLKAIQLTHDITFSNSQVTIGMAWNYIQPGTTKVLFHDGGTKGYSAYFAVNPQKKVAVVILSNSAIAPIQDGDVLMAQLEY
jgi:CubicO group peptidase (beta-lactamase class C family)